MERETARSDSVELFVRSLSPVQSPVTEHVDRIRDLQGPDGIESASITVWGDEVGLSTTAYGKEGGRAILDRVAEFRSWADSRDLEIEPFFERRSVTSDLTGESYAALRLPVSCLAEYAGDELVHVTPHCTGNAVCSVADRLSRLEDRNGTTEDVSRRADSRRLKH